jgi:hypothetical protein
VENARKTQEIVRPLAKMPGLIAFGFTLLSACAYRLPVSNIPSRQYLMIVAKSPERYVVRVKASDIRDFPVSSDGRVTIDVPRLPRADGVYLFDRIRIRSGVEPLTTKSIQLLDSGNTAARLSLAEIAKLPSDPSGYHILRIQK